MRKRKERIGVVVSDKMQKTVTVRMSRRAPHLLYKKIVTTESKVKAHDEKNQAKEGDTVRIVETRPLSKTKRWKVAEIMGKAGKK